MSARNESGRQHSKPADRWSLGASDRAYRLRPAQDGSWVVDGLPWVTVSATSRRVGPDAARVAIAHWLDVPLDSLDVEPEA